MPAYVLDVWVTFGIFLFSSYIAWDSWQIWQKPAVWPGVAIMGLSLLIAKWTLLQRSHRVLTDRMALACLCVVVVYAAAALWIVVSRTYYSRSFFLASLVLLLAWQIIDVMMIRRNGRAARLAAIPSGMVTKLTGIPGLELRFLSEPKVDSAIDGIVVDMHKPLSKSWTRFVAESAANGIPVYHAASIYEVATTRVSLEHAHAGWLRELINGSTWYLPWKRAIDVLVVLLSLPVVVPLSILLAVLIKMDSRGPVLFVQHRVGQGGRVFQMVKFRSMKVDAGEHGPKFADSVDDRVTRVGHFLRRYRLDELPQLWNVLKGEMSLVGPRPEQVDFAREFEQKIPFYRWRHRVKPGITGWAQVQQGYAAGLEDTLKKLEYDLYYVKHLSFWLDLSIILETVRTIVTGFGSR